MSLMTGSTVSGKLVSGSSVTWKVLELGECGGEVVVVGIMCG